MLKSNRTVRKMAHPHAKQSFNTIGMRAKQKRSSSGPCTSTLCSVMCLTPISPLSRRRSSTLQNYHIGVFQLLFAGSLSRGVLPLLYRGMLLSSFVKTDSNAELCTRFGAVPHTVVRPIQSTQRICPEDLLYFILSSFRHLPPWHHVPKAATPQAGTIPPLSLTTWE